MGWSLDNPRNRNAKNAEALLTIIRDGVITPNETQALPDSKPVKFLEVPPIIGYFIYHIPRCPGFSDTIGSRN